MMRNVYALLPAELETTRVSPDGDPVDWNPFEDAKVRFEDVAVQKDTSVPSAVKFEPPVNV